MSKYISFNVYDEGDSLGDYIEEVSFEELVDRAYRHPPYLIRRKDGSLRESRLFLVGDQPDSDETILLHELELEAMVCQACKLLGWKVT